MNQEHYTGPRKRYMSGVALHRKQNSKEFILACGGEEEKKVHGSCSVQRWVSVPVQSQAAKGAGSSDGQRDSTVLDLSSPGFRAVFSQW